MLPFFQSSTDYKDLQEWPTNLDIIQNGQSYHKKYRLREMNGLLSLLEEMNLQHEKKIRAFVHIKKKSTSSSFLCLVWANFPQAEKHATASTTCLYQARGGTTTTAHIVLQVSAKLCGLKNSILYNKGCTKWKHLLSCRHTTGMTPTPWEPPQCLPLPGRR